jgi:predicted xylose isomerase-like sugar epimerase
VDKLSKVINPENIDVPGLVRVLQGIEERLTNIEQVLDMDDSGYRVNDEGQQ